MAALASVLLKFEDSSRVQMSDVVVLAKVRRESHDLGEFGARVVVGVANIPLHPRVQDNLTSLTFRSSHRPMAGTYKNSPALGDASDI